MRRIQRSQPKGERKLPRPISWRMGFRTRSAVYGYGVRISVDRGRLIIADGFANEGERRRTILSRGTCRLQRLVVLGRTGVITLDALQWLMEMGVGVLFINPNGKLTSTLVPGGLEGSKVRLHRIQATARDTQVGVKIARTLIGRKLRGQLDILNWLADPGRQIPADRYDQQQRVRTAVSQLQPICAWVENVPDIEGIVLAECDGAGIYWSALSGIPLKWTPNASRKVPEHWLCTQPRESYRTGNRYGATDPGNALLNYGYALLEAETRIACLNAGLHPGLGIFHADKDARASFVYDLMEPSRPTVDRLALDFIRSHTFHEGECWETREGFCRLDPLLASQIAHWAAKVRPPVTAMVRELTHGLTAFAGTKIGFRTGPNEKEVRKPRFTKPFHA